MLKPLFFTRSFALNPCQPALKVEAADWSAVGGPATARLNADPADLGRASAGLDFSQAVGLLRCPVELVD